MDVSVIMVNYNTCEMTMNAIKSILEKTTDISYEIIVVDNGSTDRSKEIFENDSRISYIYSEKNLGFGRANNLGLKIAKGRNILFLNTDTLLLNNAVKILSDYIDSDDKIGVCGGNLYSKEGKPAVSFERFFPGPLKTLNYLTKGFLYKSIFRNISFNHSSHPIEVAYVCGADMMVKRSVLDECGSFSPQYFMYYEETDLCRRIKKSGKRIRVVPDAKIIHLEGGTVNKNNPGFNYRKFEMQSVSRKIFIKTAHGPFYRCLDKFLLLALYRISGLLKPIEKKHYYKLIDIYCKA